MRLFRQARPGDWGCVFAELASALANRDKCGPTVQVELHPGEAVDVAISGRPLAPPAGLAGLEPASAPGIAELEEELRRAHGELAAAEAAVRARERAGDFGGRFVELVRRARRLRQCRTDLRNGIDELPQSGRPW
jgi:hypothetical protein